MNVVDSSAWLELPLADSIILATARRHESTLWTRDSDFNRIPGVEYRRPRGRQR
jgi:predicted nucleic acid-binding protein